MSMKSTGQLLLPLMSSQEDTRASLFPLPGSEKVRGITATSGRECLRQSRNSGPLGFLEKMLLGTSRWASIVCLLTWRHKATPAGHSLYQLVPLEQCTSETACGLLPTMTKTANLWAPSMQKWKRHRLLPTLTRHDVRHGATPERTQRMWEDSSRGADLPSTLRVLGVGDGGINPSWAEEYMGFPIGWTELEPSETP